MFLLSLFLILVCVIISFSGFSYLGILVLLENLNVIILFYVIISGIWGQYTNFIIFIVVSTIEVTLGLVILTRLWNNDSLID
uniref:NADH dehydrogenase subunit 4L n=1 Tax=Pseudorhabdosynochus yangjiangensis TaxID=1131907 RepID=A0A3G0WP20_9PLAT|nr:NADH dehydrogenase subunit 4L [Pseudorhabdosynochus yangjiangensis]